MATVSVPSEKNPAPVTEPKITDEEPALKTRATQHTDNTKVVKETTPKPETKTSYSMLTSPQDVTEPKTDPNKWTNIDDYKKCMKNFEDTGKTSTNVRAFWAKSNNGKYCNGYSGGYIYHREENPNSCSQKSFRSLNNGEWKVTLKNGKSIRGIAWCSNTSGKTDELRDNINENGTGSNCWCKITKSDLTECATTQKFSWDLIPYRFDKSIDDWDIEEDKVNPDNDLPVAYFTLGENTCPWLCAYECGYHLLDYGNDRQRTMHGVPHINEYYEKWQQDYKKHIADAYGIS